MSLEIKQVQRIAHLARIAIDEAETEAVRGQLNNMLSMIETMQAVDTRGVMPMAHAQDVAQRLREDRVGETNHRDTMQALAPESEAGLYLVPKVIE